MKVVLDTAKVTVPVGNWFADVARGIREANINRKARKFNRQMDDAMAIMARAEELATVRNAPQKVVAKRATLAKNATKKARR